MAPDINLEVMAQKTEGLAGSDIEVICRESAMIAIRAFIKTEDKKSKLKITKQHFDMAINWLKTQKGEE